jgi:hypothetical protein
MVEGLSRTDKKGFGSRTLNSSRRMDWLKECVGECSRKASTIFYWTYIKYEYLATSVSQRYRCRYAVVYNTVKVGAIRLSFLNQAGHEKTKFTILAEKALKLPGF